MATSSNTINQASSVRDWVRQLSAAKVPVDGLVKQAALQKLHANNTSADKVAAIIGTDPALCLNIMLAANQSLSSEQGGSLSLSHSVSLLGVDRVETLLRQSIEYNPKTFAYLDDYRQELAISVHAAYQAEYWAQHNSFANQQSLFWPTLFQRAPIWAMWFHAGELMDKVQQQRAKNRGASHFLAERNILGTNTVDIARRISAEWQLPKLAQQSWQLLADKYFARQCIHLSRITPEQALAELEQAPELRAMRNRPAFLIALCNRLTDHSDWNWQSGQLLRLYRLLAVYSAKSVDQCRADCHQQAAEASRAINSDVFLPAAQLLSFDDKTQRIEIRPEIFQPEINSDEDLIDLADQPSGDDLQTEQTQHETLPSTEPQSWAEIADTIAQSADLDITDTEPRDPQPAAEPPPQTQPTANKSPSNWTSTITRLRQQPDSFNNRHQVLSLAVNSLCELLGMERATASLFNIHTQQLRYYCGCGDEDSPALTEFQYRVQTSDLCGRLLKQPLGIFLEPSNFQKIWPLVPGALRQASGVEEFFIMSVFIGDQPFAVIYADKATSNAALSEKQYVLFKQLCTAVSQCLSAMA